MLSLLRFREVDTAEFLKHNNNSQRRGRGSGGEILQTCFNQYVPRGMFLPQNNNV